MKKYLVFLLSMFFMLIHSEMAFSYEKTFKEAQIAYQNGQYKQAGALFEKVGLELANAGDNANAQKIYNNAGVAYLRGEHYAESANVYENLLKKPESVPVNLRTKLFQNLVVSYIRQDKNALSADALERSLIFLPKQADADLSNTHAQLGDAYLRLELYLLAEEHFIKANSLLPKNSPADVKARILTALGLCQGNLGNFEEASKNLQTAYTLSAGLKEPLTEAESSSNLGILYWERGDYPKAYEMIKRAIEIEKKATLKRNEGVDNNNLGLVQKSIGDYSQAMTSFNTSLKIAKEIGNKRDEAIALVNLALLNRITGQLQEAKAQYQASIALFKEIEFQEGLAGAFLGLGKIAEIEDRDYVVALDYYNQALGIYTKLSLPRGRAESLLQLGGIYKITAMPTRTSRDLVFDEEPTTLSIEPNKALVEAKKIYTEALNIAEMIGSKEMTWAAYQGLGYCAYQLSNLEEAFDYYNKAINIVTSLQADLASVQLLGEYMAGKEDLYSEAMQVCSALYDKTKDIKYLTAQISFDETLRNEIQKASAALVQMQFEDQNKQNMYTNLMELGKKQNKLANLASAFDQSVTPKNAEEKKILELQQIEAEKQKENIQKIDADYKKLLAEWKKYYPEDQIIFESNARVDISKIQTVLKDDQVMLQYISLPDKLLILAISNTKVNSYAVDVSQEVLDNTIRKDFLVSYVEGYRKRNTAALETEGLEIATKLFSQFYTWLIAPVEADLVGKKRLYIVNSGFLSALPFGAIVTDVKNGKPYFLVEKYDISYVRPSFIESILNKKEKNPTKKLLAVGNPSHKDIVSLPSLSGAEKEVGFVSSIIQDPSSKDVQFTEKATEAWLIDQLKTNSYETLYFATHGVPYSEVYHSYYIKREAFAKYLNRVHKSEEPFRREEELIHANLKTHSPLNGYLYMARESDNRDSGLLTIKKILELPQSSFANMRYAFLSACNTGVTFASKTLKDDKVIDVLKESKDTEIETRKAGWMPGVDQISFIEPFMSRGLDNVYATLWFADDKASEYIMSRFVESFNDENSNQDMVTTYSQTLRDYIVNARNNSTLLSKYHNESLNPYYWAVGAIFGK